MCSKGGGGITGNGGGLFFGGSEWPLSLLVGVVGTVGAYVPNGDATDGSVCCCEEVDVDKSSSPEDLLESV